MTEKEWRGNFSENLEYLIRESGYTQREVADMAGVGESTLSRYLSGSQVARVTVLLNFAYVLDCTLDDMADFGEHVTL